MAFDRRPPPPYQALAIATLRVRESGFKIARLCFQCGTAVTGRKLNWCSPECVAERLKSDQGRIRYAVQFRDKGLCASCGVQGRPWQADHIVPLVEGGTHDMENLRTLCVPCHKVETAALARRRAVGRSG